MYLKHLRLKNFRCFTEASLDFDRPGGNNRKWTVLVGENSTGKTAIMQAIALALSGSEALGELIGHPDKWIRAGAESAEIEIEIETASGQNRSVGLRIERGDVATTVQHRSADTASDLNDALAHTNRNYLAFGYGASRRRSSPDTGPQSTDGAVYRHPRARSLYSLFDINCPLRAMEESLFSRGDDGQNSVASAVAEMIGEVFPEVTFRFDPERLNVLCGTMDGEVPVSDLGDGYQNLISLIGDLLHQITTIYSDYSDPRSARCLLMVDSLESQLHPKLQRRLLDFLERSLPNMQLIVTTQSLVIAQQTPEDALHYTVRRPEGVEIARFNGDPRRMRLNQLMMTEAFGDSTYESLEVEQMKETFLELYDKAAPTSDDQAQMAQISQFLDQVPPEPGLHQLDEDQLRVVSEAMKIWKDTGEL